MSLQTISLASGSSFENERALAEVRDFTTTDTGLTYRVLAEPLLSAELARSSNARSGVEFLDSITFQPCPYSRNQDRHIIEAWDLPGGIWTFIAIFDGTSSQLCYCYSWHSLMSRDRAFRRRNGGSHLANGSLVY